MSNKLITSEEVLEKKSTIFSLYLDELRTIAIRGVYNDRRMDIQILRLFRCTLCIIHK